MPAPNESGDAHHSHLEEMAAFDRLPKTIRAVLNDAVHNFNSVQVLNELHNYRTCKELITVIKTFDAQLTQRQSKEKSR